MHMQYILYTSQDVYLFYIFNCVFYFFIYMSVFVSNDEIKIFNHTLLNFVWNTNEFSIDLSRWKTQAFTNDDVIKWKHFPRYWPFVWGIHRSPVNSPHKGQWHGALLFSLINAWNGWVNTGEAAVLRHHRAHYDVTVMRAVQVW